MENKNKAIIKHPPIRPTSPQTRNDEKHYSYRPKNPNPKHPKDKIK